MEHIRLQLLIKAPVEHVWDLYCDTSRWHDWMPRMESVNFSGPVDQVGTTYVGTGKMMGIEFKSTYTIVEVEPLKLIHEHTSDQGSQDNFLRFERDGDATRLTIDSDYGMPAHMPGIVKNMLTKSFFERNMRNMLEDFKALAEATVPVPA